MCVAWQLLVLNSMLLHSLGLIIKGFLLHASAVISITIFNPITDIQDGMEGGAFLAFKFNWFAMHATIVLENCNTYLNRIFLCETLFGLQTFLQSACGTKSLFVQSISLWSYPTDAGGCSGTSVTIAVAITAGSAVVVAGVVFFGGFLVAFVDF